MQSYDEIMLKNYVELISDQNKSENEIQEFLENNSELIPLEFLRGHHLHFNTIISKFPLGRKYKTDFAYLTKDSVGWTLVLVEIETAKKKIFKNSANSYPQFTADFNRARSQVSAWKSYVSKEKENVLSSVKAFKKPLVDNDVDFKYLLIIGRDENFTVEQMERLKSEEGDSLKILTYDSLLRRIEHRRARKKLIVSIKGDDKYKIKKLPQELSSSIFAYVTNEELVISMDQKKELISQGYDIDKWSEGHQLRINDKYSSIPDKIRAENESNETLIKIFENF